MNVKEIRLHAPILMSMKVMVINHETQQAGEAEIILPPLRFVSLQQQKDRFEDFINEELKSYAPGFQIMTKAEAWHHYCNNLFNEVFAVPGDQVNWDKWDDDIDDYKIIGKSKTVKKVKKSEKRS